MPSNILLTSAGRRVELVQHFRAAMNRRELDEKIIAADAQSVAPAMYFADDSELLPRVADDAYVDALCTIIERHRISVVVPTIDPELPHLARHRRTIEDRTGATVMVASEQSIAVTADKMQTHRFLEAHGIPSPLTWEPSAIPRALEFPAIIKPRAGSSSIGVHAVRDAAEIEFWAERLTDPVVQQMMDGEEYTVDCFSNWDGTPITIVPRRRIKARGGEILNGQIHLDPMIIESTTAVLEALRMPGHSTVQCFKSQDGVHFIEVNARFGGGAPMSIAAGADSCANVLRIADGEVLAFDNESVQDGLLFMRYDQCVTLQNGRPWGTER